MKRFSFKSPIGLQLVLFSLIWLLLSGLSSTQEWQLWERWGFDQLTLYHSTSGQLNAPQATDIIIVGIDEPSFNELQMQWPWPRAKHAELIERLSAAGARTIAFDILFSDPSQYGPEDDQRLVTAIENANINQLTNHIVLASHTVWQDTQQGLLNTQVSPLTSLLNAGAKTGLAEISPDADGILRKLPQQPHSFWQTILNHPSSMPPQTAMVNYLGPAYTFPYVHYYQALEPGLLPAGIFKDRLVLIGLNLKASAEVRGSAIDRFMTPYYRADQQDMPAVEFIANVLENIRHNLYIQPLNPLIAQLLLALIAISSGWILLHFSFPKASAILALLLTTLLVLDIWLFSSQQIWWPLLAPVALMLINYLAFGAGEFYQERQRRHRLAEENRQLQAQQLATALETAERLKALDKLKDDFLAKTSHELRTPLQGILGLTEHLYHSHQQSLSQQDQNQFQTILNTGKRLSGLINDVLDFSQLQHQPFQLKSQPVEIKTIIHLCVDISRPLAKQKQLGLETQIPDQLPPVMADENRLQQVILNLISNAIKFTPQGEVRISIAPLSEQPKPQKLRVAISDTGIGIAEAELANLFTPFQQGSRALKEQIPGTGIGLALCQQLLELMGGKLWVDSVVDQGSTFSFEIPLANAADMPEAAPILSNKTEDYPALSCSNNNSDSYPNNNSNSYPNSHATTKKNDPAPTLEAVTPHPWKILVVDDDPTNLEVIRAYLGSALLRVDCVSHADAALQQLQQEDYHLLLLDIMLPGKSGFQLCSEIRAIPKLSPLRIIFLSAKGQIADVEQGFAHGADDYLIKPFSRNELWIRLNYQLSTLKSQSLFDSVFAIANRVAQFKENHQAIEAVYTEIDQQLLTTALVAFNEESIFHQKTLVPNKLGLNKIELNKKQLRSIVSLESIENIGESDLLTEQNQELNQWFQDHFPQSPLGFLVLLPLSLQSHIYLLLYRDTQSGSFNLIEQHYLKSLAAQLRTNKQNIKQIIRDKSQNEQLIGIEEMQANIIYIKGNSPYSTLVFDAKEKNCRDIRISMSLLSEYFDHSEMIQVHRSYLVNPIYVQRMIKSGRDYQIELKDKGLIKTRLPVARSHVRRLKQFYSAWFN